MGNHLRNLSRIILAICWAFILLAPASAKEDEPGQSSIVREIIVEGSQRIEAGTIKSYLLIRKGDKFNVQRIDRSLKSLFSTGLFADVSIQRQGDDLIVKIIENPVINRIAFEGNNAIETDVLKAEITLRPRVIYTRAKVQSDVKRLLAIYRLNGITRSTASC